jgi:hypothetical protein
MSISVSDFSSLPQTPPPAQASSASYSSTTSVFAKAPNGDYVQPNDLSVQTPDASGGYKPLSTASSAATVSSPAVQSALTTLVKGG